VAGKTHPPERPFTAGTDNAAKPALWPPPLPENSAVDSARGPPAPPQAHENHVHFTSKLNESSAFSSTRRGGFAGGAAATGQILARPADAVSSCDTGTPRWSAR